MNTFEMTEPLARKLADLDKNYHPMCLRGEWVVMDAVSEHVVEFDRRTLVRALEDVGADALNAALNAHFKR